MSKRLADEGGAVALEALLSLMLMVIALYAMWGAAVIVYDQSKAITGVQSASQGALLVYDRSTYRGGYPYPGSGYDDGAYNKAYLAAHALLYWNSEGLLPDPFGASTVITDGPVDVSCGPSISGITSIKGEYGGGSCKSGDAESAAVTRVEVDAYAQSFLGLIAPTGSPRQQQGVALTNDFGQCLAGGRVICSTAISVGPKATP
jgi:hypothetical protein